MMKCSGLTFAGALLATSIGTFLVTLAPPAVRGGVLLQGYYQQRNGAGVPPPADGAHPGGDSPTDFWWDHLAKQAKALREAGFTAVWLPPVWKGASGTFSVGFDVFIDAKNVTQDYEGAGDLDIQPADSTAFVQVCRVFVDSGQPIKGELHFDTTGWPSETSITLELDGPDGTKITSRDFDNGTAQGTAISANAAQTGFYTLKIRSANTPAANPKPSYKLTATYRAPQELK
jgi:hypothetical protein